jgi:hypothetical protein
MSLGQATETNKHNSVKTMHLRAAAARTKGTVVRIGTGHTTGCWTDISLADDTNLYRVAVVNQDCVSGAIYEAVTEGTVKITVPSGNYTVGNGVKILDGALADSAAAATAPDDLAANISIGCIVVGGTAVTEITVSLHGDRVTATT